MHRLNSTTGLASCRLSLGLMGFVIVTLVAIIIYYAVMSGSPEKASEAFSAYAKTCNLTVTKEKSVVDKETIVEWYTNVIVDGIFHKVIVDMGSCPLVLKNYTGNVNNVCNTQSCSNTSSIKYGAGTYNASIYYDVIKIGCLPKTNILVASAPSLPITGILGMTDSKQGNPEKQQISGFINWNVLNNWTICIPTDTESGSITFNDSNVSNYKMINRIFPSSMDSMQMNFYVINVMIDGIQQIAILDSGSPGDMIVPKTANGNTTSTLEIVTNDGSVISKVVNVQQSSIPFVIIGNATLGKFKNLYLSQTQVGIIE